ncbi:MAG TPA: enoyl-CoA hydratase-related protein [Candidatus Acidoferrales bacterium]|nr:enoyl-CoA hydratase-related protein [Candidatus Acidoferrales bacterium]
MATVILEKPRPHVTLISMNRPQRLNAMSIELCLDLKGAFEHVTHDNDCRVVVLTGAGRAFCSGLDLKDHSMIPNIDGLTIPRIGPRAIRIYSQLIPIMRHLPQPIIAAVNGPAYGGGMCLTLGADLRIASESAVFNATGIVNGLTSTELGASWLLPRLIGAAHANETCCSPAAASTPPRPCAWDWSRASCPTPKSWSARSVSPKACASTARTAFR